MPLHGGRVPAWLSQRMARLGQDDKLAALRRLDAEARRLEAVAGGADFATLIERERRASYRYGGRTVNGPARAPAAEREPAPARQLSLF